MQLLLQIESSAGQYEGSCAHCWKKLKLCGIFVCLFTWIQMTFTRPANHRQLTFEEIAKSAKVTVNEVSSGLDKLVSVYVLMI